MTYSVRKHIEKAYKPARNKFMLLVTNRYTVHVVVAVFVIITGVLNLQTNEVRAETFGERSLMYKLVTSQDYELIEEYSIEDADLVRTTISYQNPFGVTATNFGLEGLESEGSYVPIVGGGTIAAPVISEGQDSVAPRESIETYVVQSGDTLSSIATQFGISLDTLLWANDLTVRSVLQPGNEMTILPVSGVRHVVKTGDTLNKIASTYDVESEVILEYNRLASADDLVVGEALIVPGGEVSTPAPVRTSTSIPSVFTSPSATAPATTSNAQPTVTGTGKMVWPSDLRVITQYFGWNHTGLDIDCHFTHDNYAADAGIVSYAGWRGGYGYLVEINHGNGIITRYGHHASMYVTAGQQVSAGQAIGRCGTTGRSTGTHLHFEVVVNGKYRNPLEYIR